MDFKILLFFINLLFVCTNAEVYIGGAEVGRCLSQTAEHCPDGKPSTSSIQFPDAQSKVWTFNHTNAKCEPIVACIHHTTRNIFESETECNISCIYAQCLLDPVARVCETELEADVMNESIDLASPYIPPASTKSIWFFNSVTGTCVQYPQNVCPENANGFADEIACYASCAQSMCILDAAEGLCQSDPTENRIYSRWHFNLELGKCDKFAYRACSNSATSRTNLNNFVSEEECVKICSCTDLTIPNATCHPKLKDLVQTFKFENRFENVGLDHSAPVTPVFELYENYDVNPQNDFFEPVEGLGPALIANEYEHDMNMNTDEQDTGERLYIETAFDLKTSFVNDKKRSTKEPKHMTGEPSIAVIEDINFKDYNNAEFEPKINKEEATGPNEILEKKRYDGTENWKDYYNSSRTNFVSRTNWMLCCCCTILYTLFCFWTL